MKWLKRPEFDAVLICSMLLAAFLYGYGIWNDQYVNLYYTTAVGSMLENFHNFFYASLDSAGSVTVDKPPVTFWVQTISAWIFGLHGWSVILPQALGGVGSVLLVYLLVKPTFGRTAARLSALAMATIPVAAAVSRTNNIDALLVFTLLLAAWFLFRGTKRNKLGSLLAAFGLIGVAFNEKMLQAYMVVPAFYLFYIIAGKVNWKKKTGVLAACTAVLLAVSLSWAVIVDSVPASERPYIGSSGTNSVLNLAFGYNGVSRLTGDRSTGGGGGMSGGGEIPAMPGGDGRGSSGGGRPDAGQNGAGSAAPDSAAGATGGSAAVTDAGQGQATAVSAPAGGQDGGMPAMPGGDGQGMPPGRDGGSGEGFSFGGGNRTDGGGRQFGGGMGAPGGGGGMFNTGTPGPLRLFQAELSGQASWLLPLVFFGVIGLFASLRRKNFTQQHKEALFWLVWLVPVMGFFSIAGFFHQYYLIMMGPPVAALAGAGWTRLWHYYKERSLWLFWLLPAAVLATAGFAWYIIHPYDAMIGAGWSITVLVSGVVITLLLVLFRLLGAKEKPFAHLTAVLGMLVLLIGPLYWALTPITYGQSSQLPAAGPDSANSVGGGRMQGGEVNQSLIAYLEEHNNGEKYLFAALNYSTAGPYIIDEGASVVILNGYSGSDPVYDAESLEALVRSGAVKYFYVSSSGGRGGGSSEVTSWIAANGTEVPAGEWQGTTGDVNGGTLYEVTLH
ncbi:glycosyltransferase family 39 protein ['Paenibacillus yunnanensis' Narsing Rao et al. 2020]|uniref:glycosyltransferase family 39 protein n=1 Tax=Paenibacillus tengchongensis TaxID=2608684 RepID=UPI00124F01F8|nr:glycosyltransferase family 39 protein [Paenibacillus tengchongensis]